MARHIAQMLNEYTPDAFVLGAGILYGAAGSRSPGARGDAPRAAEGSSLPGAGGAPEPMADSVGGTQEAVPLTLPLLSRGFVQVPVDDAGPDADDMSVSESGSSAKRRRQDGTGGTGGSLGESLEGDAPSARGDALQAAEGLSEAAPPGSSPAGSPAQSFSQLLAGFKDECPGYCFGLFCGKCGHACSKKKNHKGRCACASHDLHRAVNEVRASLNPEALHVLNQALLDCLLAFKVAGSAEYVGAAAHPTPEEVRGVPEKFNASMRDATLTVATAWTQLDAMRRVKGGAPFTV